MNHASRPVFKLDQGGELRQNGSMPTAKQLLRRLEGDPWRKNNPFSDDIKTACEVLIDPFARDDERKEAIRGWLAKFQPCVFGQVAARSDRLFISILDEDLLSLGDQAIREKLTLDRNAWKQWSLGEKGLHGFLLLVLSPRVHYAAPNCALKDFAERIRWLFMRESKRDPVGNDMVYEALYLKNPQTGNFHRFRVILDFFASAGDRRWWHDHRIPGGIAFTFNSLGHMARTREWYERNTNPVEWAAKMGMLTISNAFDHPKHGKATQLIDLENGASFKSTQCPFGDIERLPGQIKGKDWTTYKGFHHTDHSIRGEFFDGREAPDHSRGEYFLDFSYIGGGGEGENRQLMDGEIVDQATIESDIGSGDEWRFAKPRAKATLSRPLQADPRPAEHDRKILVALAQCRKWLKTPVRV
jgi:hypothetical protein